MIVAFSALKGSGKDSCVNYLSEKYGFKRISFADPLKDMVSDYYQISRSSLDNSKEKENPLLQYPVPTADDFTKTISDFMIREFRTAKGFLADVKYLRNNDGTLQTFLNQWETLYHTPRSLAILIGSAMRSGDTSFWIKQAIKTINQLSTNEDIKNFAISDLRYQSEFKQLREMFSKDLVTIRINRFDFSPSTDPSELDLVNYPHDFTVNNKGTLEELYGKIDEILNVWI